MSIGNMLTLLPMNVGYCNDNKRDYKSFVTDCHPQIQNTKIITRVDHQTPYKSDTHTLSNRCKENG
uniref:Uncharacterized protein n=1 Tax=Rhizophora mucronata TaxID=61149 RepID=A0A2P2QBJ1_RHIMU